MTDANQNFSKVACLVDEQGTVVILKNNKPRYAVIDFSEYDDFRTPSSLQSACILNPLYRPRYMQDAPFKVNILTVSAYRQTRPTHLGYARLL